MLESPVSDLLGRMDLEAIDSPLLVIGAGLLLLAFGRRLYWLLVGLAGFVAGYYLTVRYLDLGAGAVPLILGVVAGLICGTVVVLFQKLAVAVVGFLAAGVAMLHIAATLELAAGYWVLIVAVGPPNAETDSITSG